MIEQSFEDWVKDMFGVDLQPWQVEVYERFHGVVAPIRYVPRRNGKCGTAAEIAEEALRHDLPGLQS